MDIKTVMDLLIFLEQYALNDTVKLHSDCSDGAMLLINNKAVWFSV